MSSVGTQDNGPAPEVGGARGGGDRGRGVNTRMRRKSRLPSKPWSAGQTCGGSLGSRPKASNGRVSLSQPRAMLMCVFSLKLATRVLGDRLPPGKFALSLWPDCLQRGRGTPFPRGVLSFDRVQFGLALDDAFARAPVGRFPFIKLAIAEQSIGHAAEESHIRPPFRSVVQHLA